MQGDNALPAVMEGIPLANGPLKAAGGTVEQSRDACVTIFPPNVLR
jgi:hypothetical protein